MHAARRPQDMERRGLLRKTRHLHRASASILAAAGLVAATLALPGSALAQNSKQEYPIPRTPAEDLTAIERIFVPPKPPPLTAFPEVREKWKDTPAFLRDSRVSFEARSYFRDYVSSSPASSTMEQAWASGGSVSAETGKLFDLVTLGAVLYTSFPVIAPAQYGNTGLLLPDQQGFAVFGQLYGQAHLFDDHRITLGRYLYNTPFLGPHDNRMAPQTFSGYTVSGTLGGDGTLGGGPSFRYGGGFIDAIKPRDAITFQSMASAAGVPASNAGVGVLGGLLSWGPARLGAINYYSQDLLNIFYGEGKIGHDFGGGFSTLAAAQFVTQNSTGLSQMNGGTPFATSEFGAKVDLGYNNGILTLGYSVTGPGLGILTPWSASPFYTSALIQNFQRAGEQAVMVGLSHSLIGLGLPAAVSTHFFNGWTSAAAAGPPLVESEWDIHVDWRPDHDRLQGLWFRVQYGRFTIWQGGTVTNGEELRVVLNYKLNLY
jgi:hypothetical protein